jgi:hypothetical protein
MESGAFIFQSKHVGCGFSESGNPWCRAKREPDSAQSPSNPPQQCRAALKLRRGKNLTPWERLPFPPQGANALMDCPGSGWDHPPAEESSFFPEVTARLQLERSWKRTTPSPPGGRTKLRAQKLAASPQSASSFAQRNPAKASPRHRLASMPRIPALVSQRQRPALRSDSSPRDYKHASHTRRKTASLHPQTSRSTTRDKVLAQLKAASSSSWPQRNDTMRVCQSRIPAKSPAPPKKHLPTAEIVNPERKTRPPRYGTGPTPLKNGLASVLARTLPGRNRLPTAGMAPSAQKRDSRAV